MDPHLQLAQCSELANVRRTVCLLERPERKLGSELLNYCTSELLNYWTCILLDVQSSERANERVEIRVANQLRLSLAHGLQHSELVRHFAPRLTKQTSRA